MEQDVLLYLTQLPLPQCYMTTNSSTLTVKYLARKYGTNTDTWKISVFPSTSAGVCTEEQVAVAGLSLQFSYVKITPVDNMVMYYIWQSLKTSWEWRRSSNLLQSAVKSIDRHHNLMYNGWYERNWVINIALSNNDATWVWFTFLYSAQVPVGRCPHQKTDVIGTHHHTLQAACGVKTLWFCIA